MYFIQKIFKIKIHFFPPKKSKFLIYDRMSLTIGLFQSLFKNVRNYNVLDVRYESINLYVLILSILRFNFKKIKENYKKIYLETVSPKVVYTAIDNNPAFFKLKNIYSKAKYISDQNGIAKVIGQKWPNDFYNFCKNYNKRKINNKLKSDLLFTFNDQDKRYMSKIISSNIYALGNSKINNIIIRKKKIKKIIFINSGLFKQTIFKEIKIFSIIKKYAENYNLKLYLLSRKNYNYEKFYRSTFGSGKWFYIARTNSSSSYDFLKKNSDSLVVFSHSTLGLEALSVGFKCVIFLHSLAKKNMMWRSSSSGFFWTNKIIYQEAEILLNRVIKCNKKKWIKYKKTVSENYMIYDKFNRTKIKLINKLLNLKK